MENSAQDLETLMGYLGDFGKYQFFQFALHNLAAITAGLHMLTLVTVAAVPDHRCAIPIMDFNRTNISNQDLKPYIPRLPSGKLDRCHIYTDGNETSLCDSWIYDTTYHKSSRGMEWNFVCSRRWMGAVAQASYMFGVFIGAITLGNAADKYGRKLIFCWSALLQLILGVLVAFVPYYYPFLVVRFLYGIFGSAGSYITGFVLTMELVGPSKRTICGVAFQASFAIGIMMVAGWGAIIDDRQTLQIIYGLHGLVLVGHWWLIDESPRWLWAQGRITESVNIIKKALKTNNSPIQVDISQYISKSKSDPNDEKVGLSSLFKTPNLRRKTVNICFSWFSNSLVYYGLSLSAGGLQGNPFLMIFLMGLVEIPGYIIIVYLLDKVGRRSLTSLCMILGGICCITAAMLISGTSVATTVVMLGKFFISMSFAIIYNYSAELFPTVVRNSALGLGSMCARLSGTLTPLITLLDSFNPKIPAVVFALIALMSGLILLYLPETCGAPMPQSIEDGEEFGKGDTCFTTCFGKKLKAEDKSDDNNHLGETAPLSVIKEK